MKYLIFSVLIITITNHAMTQNIDFSKVSSKNAWFKVGVNAGVPLQPSNSNFILGIDASLQFLETKASGIGIKSGFSKPKFRIRLLRNNKIRS
jgi:hypothetical protein